MTVDFTAEQYGAVARALVFIAAGRRFSADGRTHRIARAEMIERAREACDAISLTYLGGGTGNSSFPDEIGLQYRKKKPPPSHPGADLREGRAEGE